MNNIGDTILMFAPILVLFVVFYFFMIKPEKKRQQTVASMQSQLQKNDKIITIGGIYGIIDDIKDNVVTIVVASGARMKIERGAIKRVVTNEAE
jgi:preprotein translocase subunit YajC